MSAEKWWGKGDPQRQGEGDAGGDYFVFVVHGPIVANRAVNINPFSRSRKVRPGVGWAKAPCAVPITGVGWAKAPCAVPITDAVWKPVWEPVRAPACGPVFDPLMGTAQGAFAHPTEDWEPVFDPLMGTAQGAFAHPTEDSDPVCNEGFAESKDPSECSPVIVDQGSD